MYPDEFYSDDDDDSECSYNSNVNNLDLTTDANEGISEYGRDQDGDSSGYTKGITHGEHDHRDGSRSASRRVSFTTKKLYRGMDESELLRCVAGGGCIFCGDMMISMVLEPFISLPKESSELDSWAIYDE